MDSRARRQIEQELRLHRQRQQALDAVLRRYAEALPPLYSDDPRPSSRTQGTDATWKAIERLHSDRDYRRLVRVIRATRQLYASLDLQCRRITEIVYWSGLENGEAVAQAALETGLAERTIRARREEILEAAAQEFRRAGIMTFEDAV